MYTLYRAVDGNLNTNLGAGCTHTENNMNTPRPWWTVDLQGFYYITSVTITNRGQCCSKCISSVAAKPYPQPSYTQDMVWLRKSHSQFIPWAIVRLAKSSWRVQFGQPIYTFGIIWLQIFVAKLYTWHDSGGIYLDCYSWNKNSDD